MNAECMEHLHETRCEASSTVQMQTENEKRNERTADSRFKQSQVNGLARRPNPSCDVTLH